MTSITSRKVHGLDTLTIDSAVQVTLFKGLEPKNVTSRYTEPMERCIITGQPTSQEPGAGIIGYVSSIEMP